MNVYTSKQVAEMLKISTRSLYTRTKPGEINAVRIGRQVRYTEEAVQKFLNSSRSGVDSHAGTSL